MTPEQRELVQSTATIVEREAERFSTVLYDRLFALDAVTRTLFPADITQQRAQLVDELSFLAAAIKDLPTFIEHARRLGARHHRYGVRPEHFELMEPALLEALRSVLGDEFTDDVERAWRRLYRLIAETMLEGSAGELFGLPP
jgi:hemoglobin-like flavoprotein